ncbi:TIM21-domain-containing protein [Podospora conica]|nr:TIM21-domain-containing protein [Schizothecium conicum]
MIHRRLLASRRTTHLSLPKPTPPTTPLLRQASTTTGTPPPKPPPGPTRRAVTPFNDDGRVPWSSLSIPEKTGRAAQQTFNLGLVAVGLALTGGVAYVLWTELVSVDSKTAWFNRGVDRVRGDAACRRLLGAREWSGSDIKAFGEETGNKWRRARPLASSSYKDARGDEHLVIKFNVQGPRTPGEVHMHLVKPVDKSDFEYKYLFLEVKGHNRVYLENANAKGTGEDGKKGFKMFGFKWS